MKKILLLTILLGLNCSSGNGATNTSAWVERVRALPSLNHFTSPRPGSEPKQPVVVVFLSSRCPCSHSHLPVLVQLVEDFSQFLFIGIHANQDESLNEAREYFQKAKLPFPVFHDSAAAIANELGANKTPHAFVFSPNGEQLYAGGVDSGHVANPKLTPFLKNALRDIAASRPVEKPLTRALGCVIKR